jgi:hypothetical protein
VQCDAQKKTGMQVTHDIPLDPPRAQAAHIRQCDHHLLQHQQLFAGATTWSGALTWRWCLWYSGSPMWQHNLYSTPWWVLSRQQAAICAGTCPADGPSCEHLVRRDCSAGATQGLPAATRRTAQLLCSCPVRLQLIGLGFRLAMDLVLGSNPWSHS